MDSQCSPSSGMWIVGAPAAPVFGAERHRDDVQRAVHTKGENPRLHFK